MIYEALPKLPWLALDPLPGRKVFRYWRSLRFVTDLFEVQALRVEAREERRNAEAFDRILVNSLYSRESVFRAYGLDSEYVTWELTRVCLKTWAFKGRILSLVSGHSLGKRISTLSCGHLRKSESTGQ